MKSYLQYGLVVLLLVSAAAGCRKDEFSPPAAGEKIPYVDPQYKHLEEVLKTASCQLFLKAYQRSNMDSVLKIKSGYTLLAPTDAVMQAAGYTNAAIAAMSRENADSLVAYYTLRGTFSKEALQLTPGNREGISLLAHPNDMIGVWPQYFEQHLFDRYYYRHYIIVSGDQLLVNGLPAGALKKALPAANGYVYPIDRLLPKPIDKSFWEALATDPRFSMFLEIQTKMDQIYDLQYRKKVEEEFGFDPGGWGWVDSRRTNYKPRFSMEPYNGSIKLIFNTMFAPTNDAFHKAGFATVEDVLAWNAKYATPPVFDWNIEDVKAFGFLSDSILAYHWDFGRDNQPFPVLTGRTPGGQPLTFYANDLRDNYLQGYPLNTVSQGSIYKMPFSFGLSSDGKPTVKVTGSNAPPATVTETINTIMGPIHVVDRLLIPNNYKMK